MRTFTVLIVILMTTISGCATDGQTVADDLAGAFGSPVNRPALDRYVQQSQAENAWMQAETAAAEADMQQREQTARLQARIAALWHQAGYSSAQAAAYASAYHTSPSDWAVIDQVRQEGTKSVLPAIKNALAAYNYQLADQLLMAVTIVRNAEHTNSAAASPQ